MLSAHSRHLSRAILSASSSVPGVTNPAKQLHDLLETWHIPPSTAPADARGLDPDSAASWRTQASAVQLVGDVEQCIEAYEHLAGGGSLVVYRKHLPAWYQAVFAYGPGWQQPINSVRNMVSEAAMDALLTLSTAVEQLHLPAPDLSTADMDAIRTAIAQVRQLVRDLDGLEPAVKAWLLHLCAAIERALDDVETFGSLQVQRLSMELAGYVATLDVDLARGGKRDDPSRTWGIIGRLTGWMLKTSGEVAYKAFMHWLMGDGTPPAIEMGPDVTPPQLAPGTQA